MTFEAIETSKFAEPIEYITFKNGTNNWYYTNSNQDEVIGARTFAPLAYTRNEPVFSKDSSDGQIKFVVPSSIPIVEFYESLPSSNTSSVTIERVNRNDPDGGVQIYWKGQVASVQREGNFATILGVPLTALAAQVPRYTYSGLCNWFLFQDRCGLTREDWRHTGTVLTIDPTSAAIITIDGLETQAQALAQQVSPAYAQTSPTGIDNYWLGGYAENADGEKRSIYESNVDGVPNRIRMLQPFRSLEVGDTVTVYAGCDRTRDTCSAKFNNHLNHGGYPDIPTVNPFTTELPPGSASSERKTWFKGIT
jgi:uncharacterized phage protein (TIGR02218 family)